MNAPALDLDLLRAWIGRTRVAHDTNSRRGAQERAPRILTVAGEGAMATKGAMVDAPVRARAALMIARQAKMPPSAVAWNARERTVE
jgi:hypothetical protein